MFVCDMYEEVSLMQIQRIGCVCVCACVTVSVCLSVCPSASISPFIHLVHSYVCLIVCPFLRLSLSLSFVYSQSVCLSVSIVSFCC